MAESFEFLFVGSGGAGRATMPVPDHARTARLLAAMACAVFLAVACTACGPHSFRQATCVDPTDDCNWSVVVVQNTTSRLVILRQCVHHCGRGDKRLDPITLLPGHRSPVTQYGGIAASTGTRNWVAVETRMGATLGCLVLDGHPDKRDGDLVSVAQLARCGDPGTGAVHPIGHVSVQSA